MKVTLLIPTLNEIDGMKRIMPQIKKEWCDQILIVDGGSTDGTPEYARACGYDVLMQKKGGLTNAYQEALDVAIGDVIIAFSPDGNSVPELIPKLIEKMKEGYDMVIVSRYIAGAKSYDDDIVTAFGNRVFTKLINVLFGGKYTDTLVMFRAWKRNLPKMLTFDAGVAGLEPHLAILCAKKKLRVAEIPGDEPKRTSGKRKMRPLINGFSIFLLIFRELFTPA